MDRANLIVCSVLKSACRRTRQAILPLVLALITTTTLSAQQAIVYEGNSPVFDYDHNRIASTLPGGSVDTPVWPGAAGLVGINTLYLSYSMDPYSGAQIADMNAYLASGGTIVALGDAGILLRPLFPHSTLWRPSLGPPCN